MKKIFILLIFLLPLFAKDCYWDSDKNRICYDRFFDITKLKYPKSFRKYYIDGNNVYYFTDTIKVRLKFKGALLILLDDFDLEFVKVKVNKTYIFKLHDIDQLFSTLTNLNQKSYIKEAEPIIKKAALRK